MTADGFRVFNRKVDPVSKNTMDKTGNKRALDPFKTFAKPKPKRKVKLSSDNEENDQLGKQEKPKKRNTSF